MKVSLNYQHRTEDIKSADELIIPFGKIDKLVELMADFPEKDYVIDLPKGLVLDWSAMKMCESLLKEGYNLYIRVHELNMFTIIPKIKEHNLKFFYSEPVKTFYEMYSLKKLDVSYVYIDAPLFFQMKEVKMVGIPLRLIPNRCYVKGTIPRENGLHGCWIRPEKLDLYEEYADVVEFYNESPKQELALWRIYIKDKAWPGDMGSIFAGFNIHMDNRLVYEGLDEMRLNCGQKCESPKPYCHMCDKVKRFETVGREWAEEALRRQETGLEINN